MEGKTRICNSVPGVSQVTTATLIAEFSELSQLNRQQAAALAGVAPSTETSVSFGIVQPNTVRRVSP